MCKPGGQSDWCWLKYLQSGTQVVVIDESQVQIRILNRDTGSNIKQFIALRSSDIRSRQPCGVRGDRTIQIKGDRMIQARIPVLDGTSNPLVPFLDL